MPAVHFTIRWPDDSVQTCYSPSTVIKNYIQTGEHLALNEFMQRIETGLLAASERVKERYGYYCSSAMDQLNQLKTRALDFRDLINPTVDIVKVEEE